MNLNENIERQLRSEYVRVTKMVELRFASGTKYWHQGTRRFVSGGKTWMPTHGLGSIAGLRQSINGKAPELRIELSGIDVETLTKIRGSKAEYYDRLAFVFWQFFDASWQPTGNPVSITWAKMKDMSYSMTPDEGGSMLYSATLHCETPFENRKSPKYGFVTDADQKARYPTDQGCVRVAGIEARLIEFPDLE